MTYEHERETGVACYNHECQYHSAAFDQCCAATIGTTDEPYVDVCPKYIPESEDN